MNDKASVIEELLDRDLSPSDLDRLAQIVSAFEQDPALAQDFEELYQVRQRLDRDADDVELSRADEDAFIERSLDSIRGSFVDTPVLRLKERSHTAFLAPAFVGGAVAAIVTLVCLVGIHWLNNSGADSARLAVTDDPTRWLPDSPEEHRAILANLAGFYDHRAGWIATTDSDTQVGLSETVIHGQQPMVTRLTLITPNQEHFATDIALFPGQDVIISVPRTDRPALRYQLHLNKSTEPGRSSRLTVGLFVNADQYLSTSLLIDSQKIQDIGRIYTSAGDYVLRLGLAEPFDGREVG